MLPTLFNHLWQSTLFAALAGLLTLALRTNHARVRHAVWLAASIKFLIPISFLMSLGGAIPWRAASQLVATSPNAVVVMDAVSQPFTWSVIQQPVERSVWSADAILLAMWLCGGIGIGVSWYVRWRRIRAVVRAGSAVALDLPVDTIVCDGSIEPGVFGIVRPVLILPKGLFERLTPASLDAVIAHELCHLRHRDNVVAAMQMCVETVFWFHPLVWWVGKRMLNERERACDEEVLRTRCQPRAYADAILGVCRLYVESPLPCVAGVTGADLKRRIRDIMTNRQMSGLSGGRKVLLAAAAMLALTVPVAIGLVDVSQVRAQSAENPTFEAATVKPHVGGTDRNTLVPPTALPGGRFVSRFPLMILVSYAYRIPINAGANGRLMGIPNWVQGTTMYDVEATSAMPPGLSVQARDDRVRAMVQALLVDRFKLVMRRESKEMPVYALVVAKGGPKLQRADIEEKDCPEATLAPLGPQTASTPMPNVCHAIEGGMGRGLHARAVTMADLAAFVGGWTDRPLQDKTGIQGLYRFDQTQGFLSMNAPPPDPTSPLADEPTVSEMFAGLGLKMEPQQGVADVWVIEHLEKPSPDGYVSDSVNPRR
jgi:bla regulator protein BlaR1